MNKNDFLKQLEGCLAALPDEEKESALQYYKDYFEDAGPENEAQIISELGSPGEVAAKILQEYRELAVTPEGGQSRSYSWKYEKNGKQKAKKNDSNRILIIIILVMLSPVLLPVAITILCVAGVLAVAVAAVFLAFAFAGILMFVFGWVGLVMGIAELIADAIGGLLMIGSSMVIIGIGALLTLLAIWVCTKVIPPVFRGFINLLRMPFERRRAKT